MGKSPVYKEAAEGLAETLLERGIGLVYGGASIGTMGRIADAMLQGGGEVIGVIPGSLADKEIAHTGLTELCVVDTMHQRKALMAEYAHGFIALPGGLGTLEELFEALTWSQLGMHNKPCGLLNVDRYYQSLLGFIQHAADAGFIARAHLDLLLVSESPTSLLDAMRDYRAPKVDKVLKTSQL
jgi:uncharacterized protein (TIGR00730 family)